MVLLLQIRYGGNEKLGVRQAQYLTMDYTGPKWYKNRFRRFVVQGADLSVISTPGLLRLGLPCALRSTFRS